MRERQANRRTTGQRAFPSPHYGESQEGFMQGFLIRAVVVGIGLWLASQIVPGVHFASTESLIAAALLRIREAQRRREPRSLSEK